MNLNQTATIKTTGEYSTISVRTILQISHDSNSRNKDNYLPTLFLNRQYFQQKETTVYF